MAIAATNLTSGSAGALGGATSQATASITPSADVVALLGAKIVYSSAPASSPTASGAGLTWTLKAESATINASRSYIFEGRGTPSAGAVTITRGGSDTFDALSWDVTEFSDAVTGSDPIQQAITNAAFAIGGDGISQAYGSAWQSGSAGYVVGGFNGSGATDLDPLFAWTELSVAASPAALTQCAAYSLSETASAGVNRPGGGVSRGWTMAAVELLASGGGGLSIPVAMHHYNNLRRR